MNDNDKQKALEIKAIDVFEGLLKQPEEQRIPILHRQFKGQVELIEAVESLIHVDQKAPSLLTGSAYNLAIDTDSVPNTIGRYQIEKLLGKGGMGAVYKAKRISGDFDHEVAIKVVGMRMSNHALVEKFQQERQTLAKLSHANIAKLYDGGELADSRPYFVMEYVDGESIKHFVDKNKLSLKERLNLFIKVCNAVQYAHGQLIVHRDITPANVLIDNNKDVKLIDFGIAKFEDELAISSSKIKSIQQGTDGFAAPELNSGDNESILTDIYSLGKLLEVMLENSTHDKELVAIIAKASEQKPSRRYNNTLELIQDCRAKLQSRPIQAYSSSPAYIFNKWMARHTISFTVVVMSLLALTTGLVITLQQYDRAERNYAQSQLRFEQLRELARYQLFEHFDALKKVAGNTQIRANLAAKSHQYLNGLLSSQFVDDALRIETAAAYIRLARVYGVPAIPNLGDVVIARNNLQSSRRLLDEVEQKQSNAWLLTQADLLIAESMIHSLDDSDLDVSLVKIERSKAILDAIPTEHRNPMWSEVTSNWFYAALNQADQAGNTDKLRMLTNEFMQTSNNWAYHESLASTLAIQRASHWYWLGLADYIDGQYPSAVKHFLQGEDSFNQLSGGLGNDPMQLYLRAWNNYIGYGAAASLQDQQQATAFLNNAVKATDKLKSVQEGDASIIRLSLQLREAQSQLYAAMGDFDNAIAMQLDLLTEQKHQATQKPEAGQIEAWAFSKIILAFMYRDINKLTEACDELQEAYFLLSPLAEAKTLASYMMHAANQLPARIEACQKGDDIGSQNALFVSSN